MKNYIKFFSLLGVFFGLFLSSQVSLAQVRTTVFSLGDSFFVLPFRYNLGILDNTFDSDGIVTGDFNTTVDNGRSIALDSSGNIYVGGNINNGDMIIWKYTSEGVIDTTFGTNGYVIEDNVAGGNSVNFGWGIALDSLDNVYVTGESYNTDGNPDMVILKYTSEGVPDTTFGTNGIVVHDGAAGGGTYGWDEGRAIILDSSDNVYVTGTSLNSEDNEDMVIWKYTNTGILDTTFGTNGIVVYDGAAGGNDDSGRAIVLDSSGNVYVTGYSYNSSDNEDIVIWKYTSAGVPDTTFGTNGVTVYNSDDDPDIGTGIALDSSGNIYVTGYTDNYIYNYIMVILKYTSEGILDTTFETDGIVNSSEYYSLGWGVTLDGLNNVYVSGQHRNSEDNDDMVIWKYTNTGILDTTFGTNGIVVHDGAAGGGTYGHDSGYGITLDAVDNIYVTGRSYNNFDKTDMVIWKYK